jgi:hypothetical protein
MSKRPIDKAKSTNRKCEYCGHAKSQGIMGYVCLLTGVRKEYWHTCKRFVWDETRQYKKKEDPRL